MNKVIDFFKEVYAKYRSSKNKTRLTIIGIFAALFVVAFFSMIGSYVSSWNLRHGFLEVSGRIEGYEYHASSKVTGKLLEMYVEEGDNVEAGTQIGKIESKQLQSAYEAAKADFDLAELEYNRYKVLSSRNATAKINFDRAEKNYRVASQALKKTEEDLQDTIVISPVAGVVAIKIVRPGEVISTGTPLVTVINMNDLFFKIFLATDVAGKVNLGNEVLVFPDALPDEAFEAIVNKIASKAEFTPKNVETKSQRAKLVFEIKMKIKENPSHKLKPGMPADGAIKIDKNTSWEKYKTAPK